MPNRRHGGQGQNVRPQNVLKMHRPKMQDGDTKCLHISFSPPSELEKKMLYEVVLEMQTCKNPKFDMPKDDFDIAEHAERYLVISQKVWYFRKLLGILCCGLLVGMFVRFVRDKVKKFVNDRRSELYLSDRMICVPHVLSVECISDSLKAARIKSPVLHHFLRENIMSRADYDHIHARHRALLMEMAVLEHDAETFNALNQSALTTPSERFLFYEQFVTLGVLGFLLDALYRVSIPYRLLDDVLQRMLVVAVKAQRSHAPLDVFNHLNGSVEGEYSLSNLVAFSSLLASDYRDERLRCVKQIVLGVLVHACWQSLESVDLASFDILLPEAIRNHRENDGNPDNGIAGTVCDALNGPLCESQALGLVKTVLDLSSEQHQQYLPGMWRTVHHSLVEQEEHNAPLPGYNEAHSSHEQRIQNDPSEVRIYDFKNNVDPSEEMNAVVRHILGEYAQEQDEQDLQQALEDHDFQKLFLFVFGRSPSELSHDTSAEHHDD